MDEGVRERKHQHSLPSLSSFLTLSQSAWSKSPSSSPKWTFLWQRCVTEGSSTPQAPTCWILRQVRSGEELGEISEYE